MKHTSLLLPFVLLLFSCGSSNSPSEKDTTPPAKEPTLTVTPTVTDTVVPDQTSTPTEKTTPHNEDDKARLVVSFISQGEGIDKKLRSDFDVWLKSKPAATWELHPWGREGEINYCFFLSDMSSADQAAFVTDVKRFFGGREKVFVNENTTCSNWKNSGH